MDNPRRPEDDNRLSSASNLAGGGQLEPCFVLWMRKEIQAAGEYCGGTVLAPVGCYPTMAEAEAALAKYGWGPRSRETSLITPGWALPRFRKP